MIKFFEHTEIKKLLLLQLFCFIALLAVSIYLADKTFSLAAGSMLRLGSDFLFYSTVYRRKTSYSDNKGFLFLFSLGQVVKFAMIIFSFSLLINFGFVFFKLAIGFLVTQLSYFLLPMVSKN